MKKTTTYLRGAMLCGILSILTFSDAFGQCAITTGPTNNCGYGDALDVITMDGTTVSNGGCSNPSGYILYPTSPWTFTVGSSFPVAFTVGGSTYSQGVSVWIDLNSNSQFEATEQVFASTTPSLNITGTMTIPATATPGTMVRMRVMCAYNISIPAANACTSNQGNYGETEDYNIVLVPAVLPDDVEATALISPADSVCGNTGDSLVVRVTNVGLSDAINVQVDATLSGMLTGTYTTTVDTIFVGTYQDVFVTTINTEAGGSLTADVVASYPADGDANNDSLSTTVTLINATALQISGPSVVCPGEAPELSVNFSGTEVYTWTENGNFLGNGDTISGDPLTGLTQFIVTSSNSCRAADTIDVDIIPAPTANFTSTTTGLLVDVTGTAANFNSVEWTFGDGGTATGLTASHTYAADGSYYVCMTAIGDCDTTVFCDSVVVSTAGIVELGIGEVSVYPNPTSTLVNINLSNMNGFVGTWILADIDGRVLTSGEIETQAAEEIITISMEAYAKGTYIFRIEGKDGNSYKMNIVRN